MVALVVGTCRRIVSARHTHAVRPPGGRSWVHSLVLRAPRTAHRTQHRTCHALPSPLPPPSAAGSQPGDVAFLDGTAPPATFPKKISSEWRAVAASEALVVRKGHATLGGEKLVTAKGSITVAADIPDGSGIH
jgi:hypothetical protein